MEDNSTIKIITKEKKEIEITKKAAQLSELLKNAIIDYQNESTFPINELDEKIGEKIKEYFLKTGVVDTILKFNSGLKLFDDAIKQTANLRILAMISVLYSDDRKKLLTSVILSVSDSTLMFYRVSDKW